MQYILIILAIVLLIVIFFVPFGKKKYVPTSKEFFLIRKIRELYFTNAVLDADEIFKELKISNLEDGENVFSEKNLEERKNFTILFYAILNRFNLANRNILPLDSQLYNLILKDNEILYHCIRGVTINKEKVVSSHVQYSGVRWNSKYTRVGSLSYTKNDIINFAKVDEGSIFMTNNRILFLGKNHKTIAIKIDDIVSYELYIDGIMIHQPNQKPILFEFKQDSPILLQDGLNDFLIILLRILNNTIDKNRLEANSSKYGDLKEEDLTEEEKRVFEMLDSVKKKMENVKSGNLKIYNELKNWDGN